MVAGHRDHQGLPVRRVLRGHKVLLVHKAHQAHQAHQERLGRKGRQV